MPSPEESHQFYKPVADAVLTEKRLQAIVDGQTPITPRELFEATADTFASSMDGADDWKEADESVSETPIHIVHASYFKVDDPSGRTLETSYLQAYAGNDHGGASFCAEFNLLNDGTIETIIDDQEVDFEEPIEVTPEFGVFVGSILFEGLLGSHQPLGSETPHA